MSERIHATYWLETGDDPARAAETIAGEQSSGTFVALATETPELKARSGAQVERLEILETVAGPSLPGPKSSARYTRCTLELSWPIENIGPSLPMLMATIAGNLFELRCVSGLRLIDLQLPPSFAAAYPGPAFGIDGTRSLAGVPQGPLIGTIIKPSVGLSPQQTAEQVRLLVDGGIDFIKDDELQADGPHCRFDERVQCRDACRRTRRPSAPARRRWSPSTSPATSTRCAAATTWCSPQAEPASWSASTRWASSACTSCAGTRNCRSTRTAPAGAI